MHESIMTIARAEASPPFVPAMPQKTIEGPAAWRGADIKDADDLAHRLTDGEIAELDAAVAGIVRGGIDHIAIDRHNFALPQLGKRLSLIRDEILLKGRGFMVIRAFRLSAIRSRRRRPPFSASARISAGRYRRTARDISWAM